MSFEGGVAGPLFNYDTNAYSGRGGWLFFQIPDLFFWRIFLSHYLQIQIPEIQICFEEINESTTPVGKENTVYIRKSIVPTTPSKGGVTFFMQNLNHPQSLGWRPRCRGAATNNWKPACLGGQGGKKDENLGGRRHP